MTIERKVGMGIAGQPSGSVNVADVFSTHLYTGNASANHNIVNGIDLAGEGGMTWIKVRSAQWHRLYDTERGYTHQLSTNSTNAQGTSDATKFTSFNSDGFTVGTSQNNTSAEDFVSWTFRKAEKFFDVVTYTGTDATRTISHALKGPVGTIFVKCTSTNGTNWVVYHKNLLATQELYLNNSSAKSTNSRFGVAPTDTVFTVTGSDPDINGNGLTYVAYLFADNTAEDADNQMIKCGIYTGNGSANGPVIDLGWEPQYLIVKSASHSDQWVVVDSMRGIVDGGADARLFPNLNNAEDPYDFTSVQAEGFKITTTAGNYNTNGGTYIYMAIRAPMMKEPSAATDVFAIDTAGSTGDGVAPAHRSGFPVDFGMRPETSGGSFPSSARLTQGRSINTNSSAAEGANGSFKFDYMNGWISDTSTVSVRIAYMFKRAKGFMDCVSYSGTGVTGRTVGHSLGVAPEMIWVKARDYVDDWFVYHVSLTGFDFLRLSGTNARNTSSAVFHSTTPSETTFTLGNYVGVNKSGSEFIAYLFASIDGISKVGGYTGNGSSQTLNCGFSAGARFILIKRTDATGDWYIWDTTRGIVAGNDPHLSLNTASAEVTSDDSIDPDNSGFIVNQVSATNINVSSATYIFYAIA